jgi:hypothetical protein
MRSSNETLYANANVILIHGFGIILIKLIFPDKSCQNFRFTRYGICSRILYEYNLIQETIQE